MTHESAAIRVLELARAGTPRAGVEQVLVGEVLTRPNPRECSSRAENGENNEGGGEHHGE